MDLFLMFPAPLSASRGGAAPRRWDPSPAIHTHAYRHAHTHKVYTTHSHTHTHINYTQHICADTRILTRTCTQGWTRTLQRGRWTCGGRNAPTCTRCVCCALLYNAMGCYAGGRHVVGALLREERRPLQRGGAPRRAAPRSLALHTQTHARTLTHHYHDHRGPRTLECTRHCGTPGVPRLFKPNLDTEAMLVVAV